MTIVFDPCRVDALADAVRELARRGGGIEEALPVVVHAVGVRRDGVLAALERCRAHLGDDGESARRAVTIMEAISRLAIFEDWTAAKR